MAWSSTMTTLTGRTGRAGSVMTLLGLGCGAQGHVQADLGAGTGRRTDLGAAAVAGHPVDDAVADAVPVGRHGVEVEAGAAVADEHLDRLGRGLGVDVDARDAGVLGGVDDGLAGGVDDRAHRLGVGAVADGDDVDRPPGGSSSTAAARSAQRPGERGRRRPSRPRTARCAGRAPGRGRAGRPWWRRRRSSGSGPASGAPSRAGGRPCRRAPGCGSARRARRRGR